jgi:hypothetical protein
VKEQLEEEQVEEEYFEVLYPGAFEDELEREKYESVIKRCKDLMKGELK